MEEQFLCCETDLSEPMSYADPVLLDERVLRNLLKTEDRYVPTCSAPLAATIQPEVKAEMRRIVAEWMMEVCEEQKCHDNVFLLAMNYVNRFLLCCAIKKSQLQLLGTACMLLASKLTETRCLPAETLVYYTDHSITKELLWRWELLVLSKLKWDLAAITPLDFLPHLLQQLLTIDVDGITYDLVHSHVKTLLSLCVRHCEFATFHPSILCCASVASALLGLGWPVKVQCTMDDLLVKLQQITNIEKEYIGQCLSQIDDMVRRSAGLQYAKNLTNSNNSYGCEAGGLEVMTAAAAAAAAAATVVTSRLDEMTPPPPLKMTEHETAITPTDVHDVRF